VSSFLTSGRVT